MTVKFVVAPEAPLLDHAGVEAARLIHAGRAALVKEHPSVTYQLLTRARGQQEATVRQWVRRLRAAGRLVTVEHDGATLLPSFQFDDAYEPIPEVGDVMAVMCAAGMSGWAVWRWFSAVNPWVEERPVDLVAAGRFADLSRLADRLLRDGDAG